jgi:hypothetical protein
MTIKKLLTSTVISTPTPRRILEAGGQSGPNFPILQSWIEDPSSPGTFLMSGEKTIGGGLSLIGSGPLYSAAAPGYSFTACTFSGAFATYSQGMFRSFDNPGSYSRMSGVTYGFTLTGVHPTYDYAITSVGGEFRVRSGLNNPVSPTGSNGGEFTLNAVVSTYVGSAAAASPANFNWSPDGTKFAIGRFATTGLYVFNFNTSTAAISLLGTYGNSNDFYATSLGSTVWSPNGEFIAQWTGLDTNTYRIRIFRAITGQPLTQLATLVLGQSGVTTCRLAWHPNGTYLYASVSFSPFLYRLFWNGTNSLTSVQTYNWASNTTLFPTGGNGLPTIVDPNGQYLICGPCVLALGSNGTIINQDKFLNPTGPGPTANGGFNLSFAYNQSGKYYFRDAVIPPKQTYKGILAISINAGDLTGGVNQLRFFRFIDDGPRSNNSNTRNALNGPPGTFDALAYGPQAWRTGAGYFAFTQPFTTTLRVLRIGSPAGTDNLTVFPLQVASVATYTIGTTTTTNFNGNASTTWHPTQDYIVAGRNGGLTVLAFNPSDETLSFVSQATFTDLATTRNGRPYFVNNGAQVVVAVGAHIYVYTFDAGNLSLLTTYQTSLTVIRHLAASPEMLDGSIRMIVSGQAATYATHGVAYNPTTNTWIQGASFNLHSANVSGYFSSISSICGVISCNPESLVFRFTVLNRSTMSNDGSTLVTTGNLTTARSVASAFTPSGNVGAITFRGFGRLNLLPGYLTNASGTEYVLSTNSIHVSNAVTYASWFYPFSGSDANTTTMAHVSFSPQIGTNP